MQWQVEYLDARDDHGIHVTMIEAETFEEACLTIECEHILCIRGAFPSEAIEIFNQLEQLLG